MTDKELVERLRENAEWARGIEWETPLCLADDLKAAADAIERLKNEAEGMRSNWSKSVITIKRLKSELTQEKIDNTNLIGELATVTAERDRYKAERDAAEREILQPLTLEELRRMDGEPIWGESLISGKPGEWSILRVVEMSKIWFIACAGATQGFGDKDSYGKTWLAYRSKPKGRE